MFEKAMQKVHEWIKTGKGYGRRCEVRMNEHIIVFSFRMQWGKKEYGMSESVSYLDMETAKLDVAVYHVEKAICEMNRVASITPVKSLPTSAEAPVEPK